MEGRSFQRARLNARAYAEPPPHPRFARDPSARGGGALGGVLARERDGALKSRAAAIRWTGRVSHSVRLLAGRVAGLALLKDKTMGEPSLALRQRRDWSGVVSLRQGARCRIPAF